MGANLPISQRKKIKTEHVLQSTARHLLGKNAKKVIHPTLVIHAPHKLQKNPINPVERSTTGWDFARLNNPDVIPIL
jgi:hypothetical protein